MKQKKVNMQTFWSIFLWIVLFAAILPLLWIANYNHSMSDDWVYGVKLHEVILQGGFRPLQALRAMYDWIVYYWHGWQGTYAAIFVFQLQQAVWGEKFYRLGTYILTFLAITSTVFFFRILLKKAFDAERQAADIVSCLVLLLWFELMPSPVQGLYWWNGASYYVLFFACMLFLCTGLLKMQTEESCKAGRFVGLLLLAFFLAGGNFITALLTAEILFANLCLVLYRKKRYWIQSLIVFVVNIGGFMLSALAPGNAARQVEYEQFSAPKAIIYSFSEAYIFLNEYTSLYVILALLFMIPFFWKLVDMTKQAEWKVPYGVWTVLAYCFFASSFTPNLYAYGNAGPGRIQNIRYWMMCILYSVLVLVAVGKIKLLLQKDKTDQVFSNKTLAYWGCIIGFVVLFTLSAFREEYRDTLSTVSAVCSLHSGEAQAYDTEWDQRIDRLLDPEEQNPVFPKLKNKPHLIYFQDIYTDETEWRNQVCAQYYHKESVRTKKKKEK